MSDEGPRPSRFVLWLLAAVSSRTPSEAVVGDILEELDARRAVGRAPRFSRLWLNWQALRFVVASVASATPMFVRSVGHTMRDAARALRRSPGHSLFILAILSVGLSGATTMFSVVDTVMFKPFPFDRSEDIVTVEGRSAGGFAPVTAEQFWAIHDHVPGLESLSSLTGIQTPMSARGVTDRYVNVRLAMADIFRVLRLKAFAGRLWTSDDERRRDMDVVVLSYALWQRRFGGDPGVVGQSLELLSLSRKSRRIIGVLPPEAVFPTAGPPIDLWVPEVPNRTSGSGGWRFYVLGRLQTGVTVEQTLAQVQSAVALLPQASGASPGGWRPELKRWDQGPFNADVRLWLLLLLGIVALIVLIACFNAANVMLTRSTQRARELAVRASLGASRRHLVATLVAESLMVSLGSSLCGLAFASVGVRVVRTAIPTALFRADEIAVDGRVFAAAVVAAIVTGLLFGIVPAWQASRVSVVTLLKDGGSTVTGARRRWRSVFLISEVACIGVLLVVSTLFITSFVRVTSIDLGFDRSHLIGVQTVTGYQGTVEDVRRRFAQIPGVTAVAAVATTSLPLVPVVYISSPLTPIGGRADAAVDVELYRVTPNYFEIMGIPFRRGSAWSADVSAGTDFQPIVVEDEAAGRVFGARDPIGQQVQVKELGGRPLTIVGTVAAVLPHGPEQTNDKTPYYGRPTAYYAMNTASKPSWVSFLLRTGPPPSAVVHEVERVYASVAPPDYSGGAGVHVIDDGYRTLIAKRRFNANLMSAFAAFALFIGVAGIYAVMASVVAQQTREIGVRVALGATPSDIRRGVLAMAIRHVLIGLAIGLPVAWWVSRGFGVLFFQVHPTDASIYVIVAVLLSTTSVAGAVVPARRAARVDPMVSLRA